MFNFLGDEEEQQEEVQVAESEQKTEAISELDEELADLQTNCMVLLQMLCAYKPSLREEIGIEQYRHIFFIIIVIIIVIGLSSNIADIAKTGVSSIEVFWNGNYNNIFYT